MVEANDGWLAISLPRPDDLSLVPALIEDAPVGDPWAAIIDYCAAHSRVALLERTRLLGLAAVAVGETTDLPPNVDLPAVGSPWRGAPIVADLSALWAGPLCGSILAAAGCRVIKVESCRRPDTTADRSPVLDARLNGAKERVRLDLDQADGRQALADLITQADMLITSARPRALASLGVDPDPLKAIWIAIVAHERDLDRIGFGDDCAAAGGLVGEGPDGRPRFLMDAVADPLTGVRAAGIALRALACGQTGKFVVGLSSSARLARMGCN